MFILFQKIIPQHLLSRLVGWLAQNRSGPLRILFISSFIAWYKVNMTEAERKHARDYDSFNDFFTRKLKYGARTVDSHSDCWTSPADGCVSEAGDLREDRILQAKHHDYSCAALLGNVALAKPYHNGSFATIYLSPKDYHRVHLPFTGKLERYCYIPGSLFSVNQQTTEKIPGLFAVNERLVCHFSTNEGPASLIMVGAMIVAAIQPVWQDSPFKAKTPIDQSLSEGLEFRKGDELGSFLLGSTVILLSQKKRDWHISKGDIVRMGQPLVRE